MHAKNLFLDKSIQHNVTLQDAALSKCYSHQNKKVCATEAAHTEKRKLRLSPNKFQAMIGCPHNNLMEFAFLPNSHSYCAQKGYNYPFARSKLSFYIMKFVWH